MIITCSICYDQNFDVFAVFRKPTDIEWRYTDDGEQVRVALRTGRIIPIPPSHDETVDYKSPATYVEGDKDTPKKEVEKITFKVNILTR